MAYYTWKDKYTDIVVEVQRKMEDREHEPDKEEVITQMTIEEYAGAKWERQLTVNPHIGVKGKGRWKYL